MSVMPKKPMFFNRLPRELQVNFLGLDIGTIVPPKKLKPTYSTANYVT